ncbi:MAG TPA: hypothetical protein VFS64_00095 [Solirubrobacterales bacterium]|nr:hypothetical protein [Solirubrobacterales bacterium]
MVEGMVPAGAMGSLKAHREGFGLIFRWANESHSNAEAIWGSAQSDDWQHAFYPWPPEDPNFVVNRVEGVL